MIKLTMVIFKLSSLNPFKTSIIQIFNRRYLEFQYSAYLLCYYLHSYYRASCKRNFFTLKWIIGDKRTRLDTNKLENITKICSYYLTSIKNELSHYGKEINEIELREIVKNSAIGEIISLDNEYNNNDTIGSFLENNKQVSQTTLILENIINIPQPFFENNSNNSDIDSINETNNLDHNINFDATTSILYKSQKDEILQKSKINFGNIYNSSEVGSTIGLPIPILPISFQFQ
ncbi:hypothetical protein Glove_335g16 [Diversispora epigaea]|uniref:Uncharacterized protein n=1 Tax=Diversispora epigaea TaxID=1348612 RepID=A0A397HQI5_9GLOM|nr:hypothetical protein Glove_335g16 [Diversispora epigaea]